MAHGVPALHPGERGVLNVSPGSNWVEKRGGLPPYINSIAAAMVRGGMTRSRAIATAVSVCKRTCATGHWNGNPKQPISPAIRAAACSAVTRWEAMKVSASVSDRELIELAAGKQGFSATTALRRLVGLAAPMTAERRKLAKQGKAMPEGRFPIRNADDLAKAIHAVGRARPNTEEERRKVRRFIIRRARELGLSSRIPDAWASDGSLK